MPGRFSYLWKITLEASVIEKTLTGVGLVMSALSIGAGIFAGRDVPLPWWVGIAVGFPLSLCGIAWAAVNRAYAFEKDCEPKISISEPIEVEIPSVSPMSPTRLFQLRIKNECNSAVLGCSVREVELIDERGKKSSTTNLPFRLSVCPGTS